MTGFRRKGDNKIKPANISVFFNTFIFTPPTMKHFLLLIALFLSLTATAQFTIKQLQDTTEEGDPVSFPVFTSSQRPEAATRINLYLQMNELQLLVGKEAKSIFEKVTASTYDFQVVVNADRLLA